MAEKPRETAGQSHILPVLQLYEPEAPETESAVLLELMEVKNINKTTGDLSLQW